MSSAAPATTVPAEPVATAPANGVDVPTDTPASDASTESRATVRRSTMPPTPTTDATGTEPAAESSEPQLSPVVFLSIESPSGKSVKVETTPSDCVLDVRQFLLECPETAEYTSYHLEAPFGILNDYLELQDYPQLCITPGPGVPMPVLKIVPDLYDERASRLHVRRLRELLVKPPAHIQPTVIQAGYEDVAPGSAEEKALQPSSNASIVAAKKKKGKKGKKEDDPFAEFEPTTAPATANATNAPNISSYTDSFSLQSFPGVSKSRANDTSLVDAVRSISFSGWNPPPGNRKLQGDLLYLELTTNEGTQVHVTANQEGFFVNQSTHSVFNPDQAQTNYKSLTLIELLKKLSPSFSQKYTKACQRKVTQHPFEAMEIASANQLSHQWLAQPKPHTYDWNRSEDSLLATYGMDNRGVQRDWNEELQSCRELPKATPQERVVRDRTMYRVYSDFVDAATKGAVAVVHGHIPPVNPMDPPRSFVFIYNSIFFSFAVDGKELADLHGGTTGDRVSYQMANQDLHGVKAYAALDIENLYTLSTVLVDYRGHRVICQSIIPGIFAGDRASKHIYGSMDSGKTIESDPAFHALMLKAAEKLHIKPHSVVETVGKPPADQPTGTPVPATKELAGCVDSKGIVGSDGRNYILDLLRAFPRDANYLAPVASSNGSEAGSDEVKPVQPSAYLVRPELIQIYCHTKAFAAILPSAAEQEAKDVERRESRRERARKLEAEAVAAKGGELSDDEKLAILRASEEADIEEQRADIDAQYTAKSQSITFNPDALTGTKLSGSPAEIAADEAALLDLAKYLKEEQLSKLMKQLRSLDVSPVDTQHLTTLLHEHGINMRYLSSIITLAQSMHLPHIESMCQQECIVRSAKHIFHAFLRNITPEKSTSNLKNKQHVNSIENLYFAPLIAKFLNSAFGTQALGHKLTEEQMEAAAIIVKQQREEEAKERREANQPITNDEEEEATEPTTTTVSLSKNAKKKAKKKNAAAASGSAATNDATNAIVGDIRFADGSRAPTDPLSPANLWTLIRLTVEEKFAYKLPAYLSMTARAKLCMLRSFCLKTGLQLACKDYDLAPNSKNTVPFTIADILDIFPVVKAHLPTSSDAREYLETGKSYLQSGNFSAAYQLLTESLNLHHAVYGPMHVDSASCYAALALTCFQVGEIAQAIDFQQRAIIIYERVLGLDSYETAHAHMHQALFVQQADHVFASMKHIRRALFIFELIAGPNHPDTAAAHMNAAMLNQESGQHQIGLKHLEAALERNQLALGPEHAQVALSHHAVAVGHALIGEFRSAVNHEKMCKSILLQNLGPKEREVIRSHVWLEHFTALAVKTVQAQSRLLETKQGKKAAALAAAAKASGQPEMMIPPMAIIPPQLKNIATPLTWVSLHSHVTSKGRMSVNDILSILEATNKATTAIEQAKSAAAQQEQQTTEAKTEEVAPATTTPTA